MTEQTNTPATSWITVEAHNAAMDALKRRFALALIRDLDIGSGIGCPRWKGARVSNPPCPHGKDVHKCAKAREAVQKELDPGKKLAKWHKAAYVVDCWLAWIESEGDRIGYHSWLDQLLVKAGELEIFDTERSGNG